MIVLQKVRKGVASVKIFIVVHALFLFTVYELVNAHQAPTGFALFNSLVSRLLIAGILIFFWLRFEFGVLCMFLFFFNFI